MCHRRDSMGGGGLDYKGGQGSYLAGASNWDLTISYSGAGYQKGIVSAPLSRSVYWGMEAGNEGGEGRGATDGVRFP